MGGVPVAPTRIVAAGEEAPGSMTCRNCSKRSADRQPYAYLVILISRCAVEFSLPPPRSARLERDEARRRARRFIPSFASITKRRIK